MASLQATRLGSQCWAAICASRLEFESDPAPIRKDICRFECAVERSVERVTRILIIGPFQEIRDFFEAFVQELSEAYQRKVRSVSAKLGISYEKASAAAPRWVASVFVSSLAANLFSAVSWTALVAAMNLSMRPVTSYCGSWPPSWKQSLILMRKTSSPVFAARVSVVREVSLSESF